MSSTSDIELVLRAYLGDDGAAAPDHVLDVVERRIAAQPQRRAWPLAWRPRMTTQMRLAAAIAAGVLIAIAGWSVLPKQPTTGEPSPSPIESALPSPPSSLAPSPTPRPASTFASASFEVPFRVTLASGWNPPVDSPFSVDFNHGLLNMSIGSIAHHHVRAPGTDGVIYDEMDPWPDDLEAWLQTLPHCTPDPPQQATVGSREALVADFRCVTPRGVTNVEAKLAAASVISTPGGGPDFVYGIEGFRNRIIEVRSGPSAGIVVLVVTPAGTFDADMAALDALLATLVFE